jgi:hypothetical protein
MIKRTIGMIDTPSHRFYPRVRTFHRTIAARECGTWVRAVHEDLEEDPMTKQQAEAVVNLLRIKYPDAAVESGAELEEDADDTSVPLNDYSVALGGTVADTIDEIIGQLKDDFGDDAETRVLIVNITALANPV